MRLDAYHAGDYALMKSLFPVENYRTPALISYCAKHMRGSISQYVDYKDLEPLIGLRMHLS